MKSVQVHSGPIERSSRDCRGQTGCRVQGPKYENRVLGHVLI